MKRRIAAVLTACILACTSVPAAGSNSVSVPETEDLLSAQEPELFQTRQLSAEDGAGTALQAADGAVSSLQADEGGTGAASSVRDDISEMNRSDSPSEDGSLFEESSSVTEPGTGTDQSAASGQTETPDQVQVSVQSQALADGQESVRTPDPETEQTVAGSSNAGEVSAARSQEEETEETLSAEEAENTHLESANAEDLWIRWGAVKSGGLQDAGGSWNDNVWTSADGTLTVTLKLDDELPCLIQIEGTGSVPDGTESESFLDNLGVNGAFYNMLSIGEGVTGIGAYAFSGCTKLGTGYPSKDFNILTIPVSVTSIGEGAFRDCAASKDSTWNVVIKNASATVGMDAFSGCSGLDSLTVGASENQKIRFDLKENGQPADDLKVSGTGSIPDSPQWDNSCSYLSWIGLDISGFSALTVEEGVTGIGTSAFMRCTGLRTISLPSSLTKIGAEAFEWCSSLQEADIPEGVTVLDFAVFLGCTSLTDVRMGDKVDNISGYTFEGCSSLESIHLSEGLKILGNDTFWNCTSLKNIDIPSEVEIIGEASFQDCSGLETVTLPDSLWDLQPGAFINCAKLRSISLPSSVKKINYNVFAGCTNLSGVELGDSVSTIESSAFYGCSALKNIAIPSSVREIGSNAFGNSGLETTTLPEGITSIESSAYAGCSSLKEVHLPVSLTAVCKNAFRDCTSLSDVYYAGSLQQWAQITVNDTGNDALKNASRHYAISSVGFDTLRYSFVNGSESFGYPARYRIGLSIYQKMFGRTALADSLYYRNQVWRGNCYGMSSTASMLFSSADGITPAGFRQGASLVMDLSASDTSSKLGMTLTEFIERMQVSQFEGTIQDTLKKNKNRLGSLAQLASDAQSTGKPVIICVFGPEGGHAVLGYNTQQDGGVLKVSLYDNNYPDEVRYLTLTGSDGNYSSWEFHLNDYVTWGSGRPFCWISYIPYDMFVNSWNNRGHLSRKILNLVSSSSANFQVKDVEGNVVARVTDGQLTTDRDDICQVSVMSDGGTGDDSCLLYVPSDRMYILENTDSGNYPFEVTMANVDQSATVKTDASSVGLSVSDEDGLNSVSVSTAQGESYQISMKSTASGDGYSNAEVTGVAMNSQPVEFSISGGETNLNVSMGVQMTVDGEVKIDTLTKPQPHVHSWDAGTVTKKPTAVSEGEKTYTCTGCGEKRTEAVPRLEASVSLNSSSITLCRKQRTTAVRVSGLAVGDTVSSVNTSNRKIVSGRYTGGVLTITAGKKTGKAVLTLTLASGKTADIRVKVQKKKVTTVRISGVPKKTALKKGEVLQLSASVIPVTSSQKISFRTSNRKVVSVSRSGKITARRRGTAKITVISGKKKVTCRITVR